VQAHREKKRMKLFAFFGWGVGSSKKKTEQKKRGKAPSGKGGQKMKRKGEHEIAGPLVAKWGGTESVSPVGLN